MAVAAVVIRAVLSASALVAFAGVALRARRTARPMIIEAHKVGRLGRLRHGISRPLTKVLQI